MRREVSEKTLEINVCAEILAWCRNFPWWHDAIWIGMKQNQEFHNGLDGLLHNAPGFHLLLQFKSPAPDPRNRTPYWFGIGGDQLNHLRRLASRFPDSVYYVFPFFNTFTQMRQTMETTSLPLPHPWRPKPRLLSDTWFLPVAQIPPGAVHRAECFPGNAIIHSAPEERALLKWASIIGNGKGEPDRHKASLRKFIPTIDLLHWIKGLSEKYTPMQAGQVLRGMTTIYFPGSA